MQSCVCSKSVRLLSFNLVPEFCSASFMVCSCYLSFLTLFQPFPIFFFFPIASDGILISHLQPASENGESSKESIVDF